MSEHNKMKIKSFYLNFRQRWPLIPQVWNTFFGNLKDDYESMKADFDGHDINDSEDDLKNQITDFIKED